MSSRSLRRVDLGAVDRDACPPSAVEAGEDVHQRRLAGARRAHDGGELAAAQVDVGAAQGVDGGVALAVALGDAARGDDGAAARCAGRPAVVGDVRRTQRPRRVRRRRRLVPDARLRAPSG